MKFTKLLVLGALLLMGSGAALAVDGNVWKKPAFPTSSLPEVKDFISYQEEVEVYLYNEKTHLFFTNGNEWATRASLVFASAGNGSGPTSTEVVRGIKVMFTRTDAAIEKGEGVVELKDDVKGAGTMISAFAGGVADVWTDNNTRADRFWKVTRVGDSYRISNVVSEPDKFLGWDGTDTRLYLLDANAEGVGIDWRIVAPEVYAQYEAAVTADNLTQIKDWQSAYAVYNVAMQLKEVLDQAEAIGATVTGQIAVYNNTASTTDELNTAIDEAKTAIAEREKELASQGLTTATLDNPANATAYITNPDYSGNSTKGWSQAPSLELHDGTYTAEFYNTTFDMNQELNDLPAGVYSLNLVGFYREGGYSGSAFNRHLNGSENLNAKIYAKEGDYTYTKALMSIYKEASETGYNNGTEVTVTSSDDRTVYIPNMRESAQIYFNDGRYNKNTLYFGVNGSPFTIGLKKDVAVGTDWTPFNNWTLTYYGNSAAAYQMWLNEALKEAGSVTLPEDAIYTEDYMTAYNAAMEGEKTATNKAEVDAIVDAISKAIADLNTNLDLWKQFVALREEAKSVAADNTLSPEYTSDLGDWADLDSDDMLTERKLTNEELENTIKEITALMDEARKHPVGAGADMTKLLTNPDFEQDGTGWTIEAASGGNVAAGGPSDNRCYEAWNNAEFDIYQVVENAPKGVYEISVQGFYRYGRTAYSNYLAQDVEEVKPGKAPVYVYMNDNKTSFTNVYGDPQQITDVTFYSTGSSDYSSEQGEDGTTYYFPNGMISAGIAFSAGMFTQSAYGVVANDGDVMRIGVKGKSNQINDSWCIWDNFKLTFQGYDNVETIKPILEKSLADVKEKSASAMGKDAADALDKAIAAAEQALAEVDGVAMFNALSALLTAGQDADASISKFAELETANGLLGSELNAETTVCDKATIEAAAQLNATIATNLDARVYNDSDVDDLLAQIAQMRKNLKVPEGFGDASDDNPKSATWAIENPDYDNANNDGWTTEAAPGFGNGLAEAYNITTFDIYQDLDGLPEGTYTLNLQGFYRYAGSSADEVTDYSRAPEDNNNIKLYVTIGETEANVSLPRLASIGTERYTSTYYTTDDATGTKTFMPTDKDTYTAQNWAWNWIGEYTANEDGESAVGQRMANGLMAIADLFAADKFVNEITFKKAESDVVRIGLKKVAGNTNDWAAWDNWKLTYFGKNSSKAVTTPDGISQIGNSPKVAKTEVYNLNGARVSGLQKGINIVKQTLSDGSIRVKKVNVK